MTDEKNPENPEIEDTEEEAVAPDVVAKRLTRRNLVTGGAIAATLPVLMDSELAAAQTARRAPAKIEVSRQSLTGATAVKKRKDLFNALEKIAADKELLKKFTTKPQEAMTKGGFKVTKEFPNRLGRDVGTFENKIPGHAANAVTVCGSVGCVVCASVGGDV